MRICGDPSFKGWIIAAAVQSVALQISGAIVNGLSLWCLCKCRKTGSAIKLQLCLVFVLLFLICTVILPVEGWINYLDFYCEDDRFSDGMTIFFLMTSGFALQLERMNISSLAVYRFIAVHLPQLYKKLTDVKIVISLEIIICAYVSVPYVMGFTQTMTIARIDEGNQYVKFGDGRAPLMRTIYKLYAYNYLIPFIITLVAYSLMVTTILYQKYKAKTLKRQDHITFSLQLFIFVDLVLDGPHAISHFIRARRITLDASHMIFHLHLVVDPLIFLFLNPNYRRMLLELLRCSLPQRVAVYLPPATTSTCVQQEASLQAKGTPLPKRSLRIRTGNSDNNSSQLTPTSKNNEFFSLSVIPPVTPTTAYRTGSIVNAIPKYMKDRNVDTSPESGENVTHLRIEKNKQKRASSSMQRLSHEIHFRKSRSMSPMIVRKSKSVEPFDYQDAKNSPKLLRVKDKRHSLTAKSLNI